MHKRKLILEIIYTNSIEVPEDLIEMLVLDETYEDARKLILEWARENINKDIDDDKNEALNEIIYIIEVMD